MNRVFLRIYANCDHADQATQLAEAIERALVLFEPVVAAPPKQYWKIPELFEFTYRLSSATSDILSELVSDTQDAWKISGRGDDRSAIWNRAADRSFLIPPTRWAEIAVLG